VPALVFLVGDAFWWPTRLRGGSGAGEAARAS